MADPRPDGLPHQERRARRTDTPRQLRRSRNRWLGGVLGGVAEFVGADPRLVRIAFLAAVPLTLGALLIPYGLLWLLLPGPE